MFLLSVLTVSETSPGWKKGLLVLTCLVARVSVGPVLYSTESLHWTCLLAYGSHINLTHQFPSGSLLRLLLGKLAFLSAQKLRAPRYGFSDSVHQRKRSGVRCLRAGCFQGNDG